MSMTNRVTEGSAVLGTIGANAGTAGTFLSNAVALDCDTARRLVADINLGTIGSSGTVNAQFQWSASSAGVYATVTGTAMVADLTGSRIDTIEASVEQIMSFAPTANFVKLQVITAVAATPFSAVIRGYDAAHLPVPNGASQGTITTFV